MKRKQELTLDHFVRLSESQDNWNVNLQKGDSYVSLIDGSVLLGLPTGTMLKLEISKDASITFRGSMPPLKQEYVPTIYVTLDLRTKNLQEISLYQETITKLEPHYNKANTMYNNAAKSYEEKSAAHKQHHVVSDDLKNLTVAVIKEYCKK